MRLAKFAGGFALFIVGMALLTVIALFTVGAYLVSWPILRTSPRNRRLTSMVGLATSAMTVAQAYGLERKLTPDPPDTEATEATENTVTLQPGEWRLSVTEDGEFLTTIHGVTYRRMDDTEGGD